MPRFTIEDFEIDFGTTGPSDDMYESLFWQAMYQGKEVFRVGGEIILDKTTIGISHQELVLRDYKESKRDWRKPYHTNRVLRDIS